MHKKPNILKKTKTGKVVKKSTAIPLEMKNYKLNELSALQKRLEKANTKFEVEEEKDSGRSIMINMKTSLFEIFFLNIPNSLQTTFQQHQLNWFSAFSIKINDLPNNLKSIISVRLQVKHEI